MLTALLVRRSALTTLLALGACGSMPLEPLPGPPKGRVLLFRGLANIFSTGLNLLTAQLRRAGWDASVHNHLAWQAEARSIAEAAAAGALARPFAAIGHSLGADAAIGLTGWLAGRGVATDLLVTLDPNYETEVPRGASLVVNFHQEGDASPRLLAPGRGFSGRLENRLVAGVGHFTIDKSPALHREVLALLESLRTPTARR